jgi:uncharacterized protein involved in exopolysaccharide biosynthesis
MSEHSLTLGTIPLPIIIPVSTFSAAEALSAAFRRKFWLLLALIVPPALAVTLVFILPPTYRAQVTLMVKTGREYLAEGTVDSMQPGPTITKLEDINSEIRLLEDRSVIADTISQIGISKLYPGMLEPSILDNLPSRGSPMDRAIKKFTGSLDISLVKMSNVLDVSFNYEGDRAMATKVLDTYLANYLKRHSEVYASGRASSFRESIDRDEADLQQMEQEQAQVKLDHHVYDITQQRTSLIAQRADAQTHLNDTIDREATLKARLAYLTSVNQTIPKTLSSTETSPNEEVVQANEALTALRQTASGLLARFSPDNPDVQRVQSQIAATRRRIAELKASGVKVSVVPAQLPQQVEQELVMDRAELTPLASEVTRYQGLIAGYGNELQRLELADTHLRILQARIQAVADNLRSIRSQYDLARTQDEMDKRRLASVVAVAPPSTPFKPAQPMPVLFVAGGVLLGLLFAGGIALWTIVMNRVLFTEMGVETLIGLPVLASIPLLQASRRKPMPWQQDRNDMTMVD